MKKKLLLPFWLCFAVCTAQTSDCGNALVVCGNEDIVTSVFGFGIQELDSSKNPCFFEEVNSIWFELNIAESGTLAFTIKPSSNDLSEDFDFYIFGPKNTCGNLNDPIRCSTTNPNGAGLNYNSTGLRVGEVDTSEGPGPDGNSYVAALNVVAGESYRLLVDRPHGSSNFTLEWTGAARFFEQAEINEPSPIELCLAGVDTQVDVTQRNDQIINSPNVFLEYYNNLADVFDGSNAIEEPTRYSPTATQNTVYVKVTNDNGCFEVVELDVNADSYISGDFEYSACDTDNDLFENFQLSSIATDINALLDIPQNYSISLHTTETAAVGQDVTLNTQNLYRSETTTIYARITSNTESTCFVIIPVALNVVSSPIPQVAQLIQCDVDSNSTDGFTKFNLNQAFIGTSDLEFYFYLNFDDLNSEIPIIEPGNYTNVLAFDQTIYYRVISNNCENSGSIQLQVLPVEDVSDSQEVLITCDGNSEDTVLRGVFDLYAFKQVNYADLQVAFYASLDDAMLENNPLPESLDSEATTVYVRLENDNQCQGIEELILDVNPLPTLQLEDAYQICTDGEPLNLNAPLGFDSYTWFRYNGAELVGIGNTPAISISEEGFFRLEVGALFDNSSQSITCMNGTNFEVLPSNRAVFKKIIIEDLSDNNTIQIEVSGDGEYEYSLDGATYQDERIFQNLQAGFYTVFAQDKKGCGISEKEVAIIGFPDFFTPNGDGANDTWQIIGTTIENLGQASISIFDRYGKFLVQMDTSGKGWDGTLNNNLLPEADYWFKFKRISGQEFKGHFTLKR